MATAADLSKHVGGFMTCDEVAAFDPDAVFTIAKADVEEVGQGARAEDKPVLSFVETKKKLVLNKTRCNNLADLFGKEDLVGKRIKLATASIQGREQIVVGGAD